MLWNARAAVGWVARGGRRGRWRWRRGAQTARRRRTEGGGSSKSCGEFDVSPSAFTAVSAEAMDLVASLLAFDPAARPSAAEARLHPFLAGAGAGAATTHSYTTQLGAAAGLLAPAAPGAAMKGPVAAPGPRMIRLAGPLTLLALAQQPAAMAIAA